MTTYRAVVKVPVDATPARKKKTLLEGLGEICMELVAEYDFEISDIEDALQDAQGDAELELEMKAKRDQEGKG